MKFNASYALPVLLALTLHLGVLALLLVNWGATSPVDVAAIEHYYIEAALVLENPHKAKEKQQRAEQKQRDQRARERREAERRKKLAADKKIQAEKLAEQKEAEASRLEQARAEAQRAADAAAQQALSEAERQRLEDNLAQSIQAEQDYRRAVTEDERAMAYVAQIQREIIQNWSRPPSARNGMQALLQVFLVPTGEVVKVVLKTSSGNDAFDRSAIQAVQKAERFVVPTDSAQFERNFREFEVLFRPEDLRL